MKIAKLPAIIFGLTLLLSACQSSQVVVDYDTSANFNDFTHYQWLDADKADNDDTDDPLLAERVKAALQQQLPAKKLLAATEETPANIMLRYYLSTQIDEQEPKTTGAIGIGGGSGNVGMGVSLRIPLGKPRIEKRVQIIVDLVGIEDNKLKWRGVRTITLTIDQAAEKTTAAVNKAIAEILAAYPPAQGE